MKKFKNLAIILLLLTCIACQKKTYEREISQKLTEYFKDDLKNYDWVVIIPGSGCPGCITTAEDYFLKNVQDNDRIKFIFTYNHSIKNLYLKLGKENLYLPNTFVDKENLFYLSSFEEKIYPMIAAVNKGKVVRVTELN